MYKIAILSPNRYSLYTTTVTELLIRRGVTIQSIFVRNLINPQRFAGEFRRDGRKLIKKIWKKLILRETAYQNIDDIRAFRDKQGIFTKDLMEFRKNFGIPVISCKDLNDPRVIKGLHNHKPDLVVFTGGGIIRKDVLDHAGHGIVNCHMGTLPKYRGMDVVEWPIIEGHFEEIGVTVHFMDKGVDTGDILKVVHIPPKDDETIQALRDRIEAIMCQTIVDTTIEFLDGKIKRQPQQAADGKQYFVMHPNLLEIAKSRLIGHTQ